MDKYRVTREIASSFSLSPQEAETARLLLEARAAALGYSFGEYMERYHPAGLAGRDENLPPQFRGYVRFLGGDAAAVLRAGQGADFSTFVHECAHVFRRQLAGALREQAEKAFGITGGKWGVEKEELFARGLEQWIKRRHGRDKSRAELYNRGRRFVDTVYRGMEHIVDIDPRMEAVYERLFEENAFRQDVYNGAVRQAAEGKLPENSHVFLGMTARIYEELGFERLPMAITAKHLYSTLRAGGELKDFNYHDLGEDLLQQIPRQLKKPLVIVQDPDRETEIISIITLRDKEGREIAVPIAQFQKGNFNGAEIDVNLVKSIYGKSGFENWLKAAIDDNRLLYFDKKRTGPALNGKLTHTVQDRSTLPRGPNPPDLLQNVSGFIPENIARYREEVKRRFPKRFTGGERVLYQRAEVPDGQLAFDFTAEQKTAEPVKPVAETPATQPEADAKPAAPHPNTGENFLRNFAAIAGSFKNDPVEAARFLLRAMEKTEREKALAAMRRAGCHDRESHHAYLRAALPPVAETPAPERETEFRPWGAWSDFNSRLSTAEREWFNGRAREILEKAGNVPPDEKDKAVLRRYSGFGGIARGGERGVLYDYYTSPPVARLVWDLLEKAGGVARGAKILEPSCGTGVFFAYAPPEKALSLTGVELDPRTAGVAKALHAGNGVEILSQSFEAFNLSQKAGGFDHVIGNAPFGERSAGTAALDMKDEKSLDNYFVSRSLDNLKDGGTMAMIAAPGVLENKTNEPFRLAAARKARFLGAVKLPDRSFRHSHTRVEPDILLFRKYPAGIRARLEALDDETFKSTPLYDRDFSEAYFENHPEHVAGELSKGTGQWGADEVKGDITRETVKTALERFNPASPVPETVFEEIRSRYDLPSASKTQTVSGLDGEELKQLEEKTLGPGAVKIFEN
ncbi:MAG: N-6 DNA methylase, partial [Treponema sp.]|nr:N-6 DNA methylase [Treponema sp.]